MGYTGGTDPHPTYASVSDGEGEVPHVESVRLRYHPAEVSYEELLDIDCCCTSGKSRLIAVYFSWFPPKNLQARIRVKHRFPVRVVSFISM